jgi:hypothetical protein
MRGQRRYEVRSLSHAQPDYRKSSSPDLPELCGAQEAFATPNNVQPPTKLPAF